MGRKMKMICLIPARLASERFQRKLLQDLNGLPVIMRTWQSAVSTGVFDRVVVVTDSREIAGVVEAAGGETFISRKDHPSGTDRIAEAASEMQADVIVNIQGDEPFVPAGDMLRIRRSFEADIEEKIDILSFCRPITGEADFNNPNNVKVVTDNEGFALYFSRAPIPFPRDGKFEGACKHIGIYAFRAEVLQKVADLPSSHLEKTERLENLRFLENGLRIRILQTDFDYAGIDTPADLEQAVKRWK